MTDTTLAALEEEDYQIRCELRTLDMPPQQMTAAMRERDETLGNRWGAIATDMAEVSADAFTGVQTKLRYVVDGLNATDADDYEDLARSIGRDIERLTGEPLGKVRTSAD